MNFYAGVDIGTSSAKLILIDDAGCICSEYNEQYQLSQPTSGWKEIHPDVWFEAIKHGMKSLLSDYDKKSVMSIGFTGQMHTTIFLDKNGESIRPAISWNDNRTKNLIAPLKEQIALYPELKNIESIISTGSPAINLFWLKQKEPRNFDKIHKFLIGPDYLVYRFSGVFGTDYCEASTSSLFDIESKTWSPIIQNILGLPDRIYPTVRGSAQIVGNIKREIAAELGLNNDVKIIVGTGDNPASYVSSGQFPNGDLLLSIGTSGIVMYLKNDVEWKSRGKRILFSTDGNTFYSLIQGAVQSAGISYKWWIHDILRSNDMNAEVDRIVLSDLKESELIFFPHLAGDKTIYGDPFVSGAFIGLGTDTTREEMTQAVIEGICFGVKQLIEEMGFDKEGKSSIKVIGGASDNKVWMQICADILNINIEKASKNISAALGAAQLAMASCNHHLPVIKIPRESSQIFKPLSRAVDIYIKKYERYKKIYRALKSIEE